MSRKIKDWLPLTMIVVGLVGIVYRGNFLISIGFLLYGIFGLTDCFGARYPKSFLKGLKIVVLLVITMFSFFTFFEAFSAIISLILVLLDKFLLTPRLEKTRS